MCAPTRVDTRLTRTRVRANARICKQTSLSPSFSYTWECDTQADVDTHAREKHIRTYTQTHLSTYMSIAHPRDPVPPIEVRDDGARLSADQSWSKLSLWCFAGLVFNYVWDRYSGLRGLSVSLTLFLSRSLFCDLSFLLFARSFSSSSLLSSLIATKLEARPSKSIPSAWFCCAIIKSEKEKERER